MIYRKLYTNYYNIHGVTYNYTQTITIYMASVTYMASVHFITKHSLGIDDECDHFVWKKGFPRSIGLAHALKVKYVFSLPVHLRYCVSPSDYDIDDNNIDRTTACSDEH